MPKELIPSFGILDPNNPPTLPNELRRNLNYYTKDMLQMRGYGAPEQTPTSNIVSRDLYDILKNHRREIDYISTTYGKLKGETGNFGDKTLFNRENLNFPAKNDKISPEEFKVWAEKLKNLLPGGKDNPEVNIGTTPFPMGSYSGTWWNRFKPGFGRETVVPMPGLKGGRTITSHESAHHFDPLFPYAVYRSVEKGNKNDIPIKDNFEAELPAMLSGLSAENAPLDKTEKVKYYLRSKLAPKLKQDANDPERIKSWMANLRGGTGTLPRRYKELADALYLTNQGLPVQPRGRLAEAGLFVKEKFDEIISDPKKLAVALALVGVTGGASVAAYKHVKNKRRNNDKNTGER